MCLDSSPLKTTVKEILSLCPERIIRQIHSSAAAPFVIPMTKLAFALRYATLDLPRLYQ